MEQIKFNRNYKKLHNQNKAKLIRVGEIQGKDLCKEFVEYDTDNKYPIELNQFYLILYFIGNKLIPFTTLRKLNDNNLHYYNHIGCDYELIIKGFTGE